MDAIEYQGCELPQDLYYDLDYVWIRPAQDGLFTLGITDPAQTMSGRIQYATIKAIGTHLEHKKAVAVLESGKWAGGIPTPFAGTIVKRNQQVLDTPGMLNISPYTDAWLVELRADDPEAAFEALSTGEEAIKALKGWIDHYNVQCMRCQE